MDSEELSQRLFIEMVGGSEPMDITGEDLKVMAAIAIDGAAIMRRALMQRRAKNERLSAGIAAALASKVIGSASRNGLKSAMGTPAALKWKRDGQPIPKGSGLCDCLEPLRYQAHTASFVCSTGSCQACQPIDYADAE